MFVYIITNIINDKKYIGLTGRPIKQRLSEHIAGYAAVNLLSRAIKKHGVENFHTECLKISDKLAPLWERHLIDNWCTKIPNGYNIIDGGNLPPNHTGMKHSEETKRKMSESAKKEFIPSGINNV